MAMMPAMASSNLDDSTKNHAVSLKRNVCNALQPEFAFFSVMAVLVTSARLAMHWQGELGVCVCVCVCVCVSLCVCVCVPPLYMETEGRSFHQCKGTERV